MSIRELIEKKERENLSPRAKLSSETKGRERKEEPCEVRTAFQRDRDRIIHSKSFRRLMHKTQVFLAPEGDHYRTRLTHTLEVSQISRTIARALNLNEDLTEAIALGHDLGHTPFGHIGEEALTNCFKKIRKDYPELPDTFEHNVQSVRVVEVIEYDGKGLNLTWEVKDGILNHTGKGMVATLEGQIVKLADRIAYINHDIDDALRANIISESDLPKAPIKILGERHSARINKMVCDVIETSKTSEDIKMSEPVKRAMEDLRDFLFKTVYIDSQAKLEDEKAKKVLESLFFYYLEYPQELPREFSPHRKEELPIKVCDYVAGMTDRYALKKFEDLFLPRPWML